MFAGGGAGAEIAAQTPAAQRDPIRLDLGQRQREVNDGADHRLPIGPQRNVALEQHRPLPGPIEQKAVIAATARRDYGGEVHVGDRAVIAVGEDDGRTAAAAEVFPRN